MSMGWHNCIDYSTDIIYTVLLKKENSYIGMKLTINLIKKRTKNVTIKHYRKKEKERYHSTLASL